MVRPEVAGRGCEELLEMTMNSIAFFFGAGSVFNAPGTPEGQMKI
jgi:hypothetical protein